MLACTRPRPGAQVDPIGGPPRAARTLCEKWAILDLFSQMATMTAVTTVLAGLPQIPTQSKDSGHELKQIMFGTESTRLLSVLYLHLLSLPSGRMLPRWWVVFRVVTGK